MLDRDHQALSFDEFGEFVREFHGVSKKKLITPQTQFERDLGITGDDGVDLMKAVETHFEVGLASDEHGYREAFGLGPNEYLFNAEGFGMPAALITLFTAPSVRAFTVGELYQAVVRAMLHGRE